MGDVPWGKVGAGALHYNADSRQVSPKSSEDYHSDKPLHPRHHTGESA